jgi:hypothetical protein
MVEPHRRQVCRVERLDPAGFFAGVGIGVRFRWTTVLSAVFGSLLGLPQLRAGRRN